MTTSNGFIAATDNGTAITMQIPTESLECSRMGFVLESSSKVQSHWCQHRNNNSRLLFPWTVEQRGLRLLNEQGNDDLVTTLDGSEFVVLFVPDEKHIRRLDVP